MFNKFITGLICLLFLNIWISCFPHSHNFNNLTKWFSLGQNSSRRIQDQDQEEYNLFSVPPETTFVQPPLVDVQSTEEFPILGNVATPMLKNTPRARGSFTVRSTLRPQSYHENFPALGNEPWNAPAQPTASQTLAFSLTNSKNPIQKLPPENQRSQHPIPNVSIRVNHR